MARPFSSTTAFSILLIILGVGIRVPFLTINAPSLLVEAKKNTPELTSTALRLHKVYLEHPPHDRQLYDILQVSPNATQAQITKSYRRLSRDCHPDKVQNGDENQQQQQQQYQSLQTAYSILKEDSTRMVYHKYGMIDLNLALLTLLGPTRNPVLYQQKLAASSFSNSLFDSLDPQLLRLIGYDDDILQHSLAEQQDGNNNLLSLRENLEERRIQNIAAALTEQMRPIVERKLEPSIYTHALAQDCDLLKKLPLGAQIIRCVGRAYRNTGQDFLRSYNARKYGPSSNKKKNKPLKHLPTDAVINVRKGWRSAKHWLEAGAASARLAATEHLWKKKSEKQQKQQSSAPKKPLEALEYHTVEDDDDSDNSFLPIGINDEMDISLDEMEHEQKLLEQNKAQETLIQAMQIEALWKVCKVDVDRIVRKACERILSGEYFFFPSYMAAGNSGSVGPSHGWVASSSGKTVDTEEARVVAAEAMVLFGDIMVRQSKQGTSWKEKKK